MTSRVRGSLNPVSRARALKRMKPSACSFTACSSAGTVCAAGARRTVRPAAMRVGVIEVAELVDRLADLIGGGRRGAALLRGQANNEEQMTNNERIAARRSHLSHHRLRFFFRERLRLAVDLQRELQVAVFVARETPPDTGRCSTTCNTTRPCPSPTRAGRRGSGSRSYRPPHTCGSLQANAWRQSAPGGAACRRRRNMATRWADN